MSQSCLQFYINGAWVAPASDVTQPLTDPANEQEYGQLAMGTTEDIDRAVAAAKAAFSAWSTMPVSERAAYLGDMLSIYKRRYQDVVAAITQEMGSPTKLSSDVQAAMGIGHLATTLQVLESFDFERPHKSTMVRKEPIGVVGLITPWNWPMNQVMCKVAPALAAGCTIVLKPSQDSPLSAQILAEVIDEAKLPAGVFNLVQGAGRQLGSHLSAHPDVDMISFTGSTQAGAQVSKSAADTIKRVALELGGKSANIILDDADLHRAVTSGINAVFANSGQTCTAPTRMLVPASRLDEVKAIAKQVGDAAQSGVGHPTAADTRIGPVASARQFGKIQEMIAKGIEEGATLLCGGLERPKHLPQSYYVKPTIFADVDNKMVIAQEEIFGPVLCIIAYDNDEDAVNIANDSPYGLSGYVSGSLARAQQVAAKMRTGMVHINGAKPDLTAPFGGYKQSGNGREWGEFGLDDFLETKAIMGYQ